MLNNILITIYNDPEKYPPTLNSAVLLSQRAKNVILLGRGLQESKYEYPNKINVIRMHEGINYDDLIDMSSAKKFSMFIEYVFELKKNIKKYNPEIVICHDMMAAFAYWLIRIFSIKKPKGISWYHNHDVIHKETLSRFSSMWLGKIFEFRIFNKLDVFTLPVEERKQYFPLHKFRGKVGVIPNYPRIGSIKLPLEPRESPQCKRLVKLIYQGSLGDNHGFSSFINILNEKINGCDLKLTLIGHIRNDYKERLIKEAQENGVENKFEILDSVSFSELFEMTKAYHIGLATHIPGEKAIYKYGATSSNKIYEYAAVGLPIVLFDTPHYKHYLDKYRWTNFVDLTPQSILNALRVIVNEYEEMSSSAVADVYTDLNYEKVFNETYDKIIIPKIQ